jgi:hypothetical protein
MAHLFGRNYTRSELLQYVGDISQIARVKPCRLAEGYEEGVLALDVTTGGGLDFTVLGSRGLDISAARFHGRSLAWRSATTDRHPAYYEPEGLGWLRSFYGGLVVTCGLTWFGAPGEDEGKELGLHGRVSNTPATNIHWEGHWEGDDYLLTVTGKVREAIVFGENVQLTRRIWARMGENRLFLEDAVENLGHKRTPHMILYHMNLGFPVVSEFSRLIAPTVTAEPRDADSAVDGENFARMHLPTPDFPEKVYFHTMKPDLAGHVTVALVNPECDGGTGLGVYCTYQQAELPCFTEWKMMGQGTYVVGVEPGNARVMGRAAERKAGRLQYLEPGERREYHLEIGVVSGPEQIAALESAVSSLR